MRWWGSSTLRRARQCVWVPYPPLRGYFSTGLPRPQLSENSTLCCFPGVRCHCGGEAVVCLPALRRGGGPLAVVGVLQRFAVRSGAFGVPYPPPSVPPHPQMGRGTACGGGGPPTLRRARRCVWGALSPASRVLPHCGGEAIALPAPSQRSQAIPTPYSLLPTPYSLFSLKIPYARRRAFPPSGFLREQSFARVTFTLFAGVSGFSGGLFE